ncbi:MAG TPA: hypothetical protein VEQ59_19120 [Polyangiaceae bacterium]|nr:hypothetical protein [Polyangiaceae bacterium]
MKSEKLQIKFFAKPDPSFDIEAVVPVFHRFIREHAFDELMIDVADYKHVKHGPGVALIGDANDYFLDEGEGRPGLLFSRKRHGSGPEGRLREGFARALKACVQLEAAPELGGKLTFGTNEVLLRLPDRLNAPNVDASFAEVSAELAPLLDKLYGAGGYVIERGPASPEPLSLRVKTSSTPALAALLSKLGG